MKFFGQVRRKIHESIGSLRFGGCRLAQDNGFVNPQKVAYDVIVTQREKFLGPKPKLDEQAQDQVIATGHRSQQAAAFFHRVKTLAGRFA